MQSDEEKKKEGGIEMGVYLSWIKSEIDSETACLELPFTFLMLIFFCVMSVFHLKQERTYVVEKAWKFDIEENANFAWSQNFGHKTVHDVNSIPDFWSWFRIGFLPLLIQHSWGFSEGLDDAYVAAQDFLGGSTSFDTSQLPGQYNISHGLKPDETWASATLPVREEVLHFNQIVAGIRLRQERAKATWESCKIPPSMPEELWKGWLGKPCMPASPTYELTPEVWHAEDFYGEPSRVEWMLGARESLQDMQNMALDMEDGCSQLAEKGRPPLTPDSTSTCLCQSCKDGASASPEGQLIPAPWLDERTQRVEIGIITYNQNYGLISLVTVNFFFNRAGRIHKVVHAQSAWANDFGGHVLNEVIPMIICDLGWFLSLTYVVVGEIKEIIHVIQVGNQSWWKCILYDYLAFWNCVDWLSVICAYAVLGAYIRLGVETGVAVSAMQAAITQDKDLPRLESIALSANLFDMVESMVRAESDFRITLMFYPYVVMLRLFKSFDAQPRLAVVTKTLYASAQDMMHFFIIFFSVFICMALNGVLLFGQEIEMFSTIDRAFIVCFRAMLGEWDWEELESVGRIFAGVWMWVFVLIVVVLLLNMLLAILMDAYAAVKSKASNMEGLPEQISEMVRRRRQSISKERVRLSEIWESFYAKIGDEKEMVNSTQVITPKDVMRTVRGIPAKQAKRTVANAQQALDDENAEPYAEDEIREQLKLCSQRSKTIKENVRTLREAFVQEISAGSEIGKLPDGTSVGIRETTWAIVNVVKANVGNLSSQIQEVLRDEEVIYAERQGGLANNQREMLVCAQDAKNKLLILQKQMEEVTTRLQQHAAKEQVRVVFGNSPRLDADGHVMHSVATQVPGLAVCSTPSTAPERDKISTV
eukprot:TRINITY_DN5821_c0_g1_i1.p1 TRINITY_DN5821_c0_g1~~TRINITY_DN5821_c0_g1_i1.p1  ORF type:complete len:974 (-),score=182.80 TRINITY_DN5821_c0_g1_i1:36-2660(-)